MNICNTYAEVINKADAKPSAVPERLKTTIGKLQATLFIGKVGKIKCFETKLHDENVLSSVQKNPVEYLLL